MSEFDYAPVWLMTADRPGDNAQALAVVEAAGLRYVTKPIIPPGGTRGRKGPGSFTPDQLDPSCSAQLQPPWPDLAIAIGQWAAPAALWVRERSGGRTKIVLIGRPRPGDLNRFALVIVASQYPMPVCPTVVRLDLPPLVPDPESLSRHAADWRPRLATMPRPLTAVLVGGQTKPFRFDQGVARALARAVDDLNTRDGGSCYVVTSPRTDPRITDTLITQLPPGTRLSDWRADKPRDNPYLGLLGCADRFVVTGDSISMMVEVAALGRPLAIFPLPRQRRFGARLGLVARNWLCSAREDRDSAVGHLALWGHRIGLIRFPRDLEAVHRRLYARGLAVPFGTAFRPPGRGLANELASLGARIRQLLPPAPDHDFMRPDNPRAEIHPSSEG